MLTISIFTMLHFHLLTILKVRVYFIHVCYSYNYKPCYFRYNGDIGHLAAFTDSCCLTVEPSNARQRKIQPEYFKEITICQPYCDGHTDIINTDHCYGKISHNMAHVKKPYKVGIIE